MVSKKYFPHLLIPLALALLVAPAGISVAAAEELIEQAEVQLAAGEDSMSRADYPAAIAHFSAAQALAPNRPGPHMMLGLAYAADGQCDNAVPELEQYLRLKRKDPRPNAVRALEQCRARAQPRPAPPPVSVAPSPPPPVYVAPPPPPPVYVPPPAPAPAGEARATSNTATQPASKRRWIPSLVNAGLGFRCGLTDSKTCGFQLRLAYDFVFGDVNFSFDTSSDNVGGTSVTSNDPAIGFDVGTPHLHLAHFGTGTVHHVSLAGRIGLAILFDKNSLLTDLTLFALKNSYALIASVGVAKHVALFLRLEFALVYGFAASGLPPGATFNPNCCGYSIGMLVGAHVPFLGD